MDRLLERLGCVTTLLTPNHPEAARLLGRERIDDPGEAAEALRRAGWNAVLLKGGHGSDSTTMIRDVLAVEDRCITVERSRVAGGTVRGTGCTLASAIAAWLGRGLALPLATQLAGDWLHALLVEAAARGRDRLDPAAVPLPPTAGRE